MTKQQIAALTSLQQQQQGGWLGGLFGRGQQQPQQQPQQFVPQQQPMRQQPTQQPLQPLILGRSDQSKPLTLDSTTLNNDQKEWINDFMSIAHQAGKNKN